MRYLKYFLTVITSLITFQVYAFHNIPANDLEVLVGLPFIWQTDQSFHIDSTNSRGEAVGMAFFKNPNPQIGNPERIAWYWNSENGFQIIAKQTELIDVYAKDWRKVPFLFYKLLINESGIVSGSFLIDQVNGHNQCPWFWWSSEEGIHLNTPSGVYELVERINNDGFILIQEKTRLKFTLTIKNIYQMEYSRNFDFYPYIELPSGFEEDIKKILLDSNSLDRGRSNEPLKLSYHWDPFIVDRFENDLKITGHGSCRVTFVKDIQVNVWKIRIGYEIDNGRAQFFIKKIEVQGHANQSLGSRLGRMDNKIIYTKELNQ